MCCVQAVSLHVRPSVERLANERIGILDHFKSRSGIISFRMREGPFSPPIPDAFIGEHAVTTNPGLIYPCGGDGGKEMIGKEKLGQGLRQRKQALLDRIQQSYSNRPCLSWNCRSCVQHRDLVFSGVYSKRDIRIAK